MKLKWLREKDRYDADMQEAFSFWGRYVIDKLRLSYDCFLVINDKYESTRTVKGNPRNMKEAKQACQDDSNRRFHNFAVKNGYVKAEIKHKLDDETIEKLRVAEIDDVVLLNDGVAVRVVDFYHYTCANCVFKDVNCGNIQCAHYERPSGDNVCFIEVEKKTMNNETLKKLRDSNGENLVVKSVNFML